MIDITPYSRYILASHLFFTSQIKWSGCHQSVYREYLNAIPLSFRAEEFRAAIIPRKILGLRLFYTSERYEEHKTYEEIREALETHYASKGLFDF